MIHCLLGSSNNLIADLTDDPLNFWNLWPPVDRGKKCFDSSLYQICCFVPLSWFCSFVNSNLLPEHDLWPEFTLPRFPAHWNLNIRSVWIDIWDLGKTKVLIFFIWFMTRNGGFSSHQYESTSATSCHVWGLSPLLWCQLKAANIKLKQLNPRQRLNPSHATKFKSCN